MGRADSSAGRDGELACALQRADPDHPIRSGFSLNVRDVKGLLWP